MNQFKAVVKRLFAKGGYEIRRIGVDRGQLPTTALIPEWMKLIESHDINVVFDVGANTGQYAEHLRGSGYVGKIISFEPMKSEFYILNQKAELDNEWVAKNFALGSEAGSKEINISKNSVSSSILNLNSRTIKVEPTVKYVGSETVEVRTLDELFNGLCNKDDNVFLKIDTQGYENHILLGASKSLSVIKGVQLELSLVELYEGESLFPKMLEKMMELNFYLSNLEAAFRDLQTGRLLQVDAMFFRD